MWRAWLDGADGGGGSDHEGAGEGNGADLSQPWSVLSRAERLRAESFRSPAHGRAFARARAVLRRILAAYAGGDPGGLAIAIDERGKPFLPDRPELRFNLSHAGEVALYAVALDRPVGVDVERVRAIDHTAVARRFFTTDESAALETIPAPARAAAFFACWARKEAYLKATGGGVASGLASFAVTVEPGRTARILTVDGDRAEADRWWLASLDVAPGHAAAVVAARPVASLECYSFTASA